MTMIATLRQWLRVQRSKEISPAKALLWHLPQRTLAHGVGAIVHELHRQDLRFHADFYRDAIRAALARTGRRAFVVVVVPETLHYLIPCLRLATRHVPVALVLNGARKWEEQLLAEAFPSLPRIRLRTLPGTMMPHGQVLDALFRHADRDLVLHDPDLYVFEPTVYGELDLQENELAAGPYAYTNRRSGLTFLTTPFLSLRMDAIKGIMQRHRIGADRYRSTPRRLAPALRSLGLGDHNFPKEHAVGYDTLDLILAMGIHEGYRLRVLATFNEDACHLGGVSYLEENYRLDYLQCRFLALPTSKPFADRYRNRLVRWRDPEALRARFLAHGAEKALRWIDSLVERLAAEVAD